MKPVLIAIIAAGAMASAAHAQAPRPDLDPDVDGDGKVTLAEVQAMENSGLMARLDVNRDGVISAKEHKALQDLARQHGGDEAAALVGVVFAMLDADKDGQVSRAERDAAVVRQFERADANRDGWLSQDEMLAFRSRSLGAG